MKKRIVAMIAVTLVTIMLASTAAFAVDRIISSDAQPWTTPTEKEFWEKVAKNKEEREEKMKNDLTAGCYAGPASPYNPNTQKPESEPETEDYDYGPKTPNLLSLDGRMNFDPYS